MFCIDPGIEFGGDWLVAHKEQKLALLHQMAQLLTDTVLRSPGIRSGFYRSMSDLAIFYIGYGLPHRVLILGLSPYTIYLQVAINIVNCQRSGRFAEWSSTDLLSTSSNHVINIASPHVCHFVRPTHSCCQTVVHFQYLYFSGSSTLT
jgi:hypothetical protein